jgi:N-acetylmuramoyl-L-alanine amidase
MNSYYKCRAAAAFLAAFLFAGCATRTSYLKFDPSLQNDLRTIGGAQYVPLIRVCEVYGLEWKWDVYARTATVERRGRIVLRPGSSQILVNGSAARLERPVVFSGGAVYVPASFVKTELGSITEARPEVTEARPEEAVVCAPGEFTIRTVIIDPGHGGKDPGAIGRRIRTREKDLTLAISKRLKEMLEDQGIRVVITRSGDSFIPLPKRARIANESGADLFVSIHINASRSLSMSGFECYYLSDTTDDDALAAEAGRVGTPKLASDAEMSRSRSLTKALWDMTISENRRESAELAGSICSAVETSLTARNRGVRAARFYVLKNARIPAVLVEIGYISNKYEASKLKDSRYLDNITDAVARGILAYKARYERTEGFTRG